MDKIKLIRHLEDLECDTIINISKVDEFRIIFTCVNEMGEIVSITKYN